MREQPRENGQHARAIIQTLIPDASSRKALLNAFADSIVRAHMEGEDKWGITLGTDRIRLNVGSIVVCTIHNRALWLALVRTPAIENLPSLNPPEGYQYKVFKEPIADLYVQPQDLPLQRSIQDAHWRLIELAGEKYKRLRQQSQGSHSPGVLTYLRAELGRELPDPAYR